MGGEQKRLSRDLNVLTWQFIPPAIDLEGSCSNSARDLLCAYTGINYIHTSLPQSINFVQNYEWTLYIRQTFHCYC